MMRTDIVLTVSESKRLIAKGVVKLEAVQRALEKGIVAIAKGTTNAYIVEEILGRKIDKTQYCTGTTFPMKAERAGKVGNKLPDVVLKDGKEMSGVSATEIIAEMKAGDVFIKGANALNYERRQAALLIGHPTSGTVGATWGRVVAQRVRWVIPVGLEKSVPVDLYSLADEINREAQKGLTPTLYPLFGEIVTEIEAVKLLTGADAKPMAAGGIGGAEGSVRLCVSGTAEQLKALDKILDEVLGEPAFVS